MSTIILKNYVYFYLEYDILLITKYILGRLIIMAEATRIRKSAEERIAILDKKISAHKANIEMLEAKKTAILNPAPRKKKATIKNILAIAKENGLSEEDIAKKLGIELN